MTTQSGLKSQFNTYDQQKCFIAYTHKAPWSEDILAACKEVLPRFGLEAWYADDQFEPGRSLKDKVVEMIANARYGIFDLSAMYDNEHKKWVMPRNVLIELGIAIALNRPVLLLHTKENRMHGCPLPACLTGIDNIIEFSGEPTLKRALEERIPQWMTVPPDKMWWTRYCLFGGCDCEYREIHPHMERWQHDGLHCHIADGSDTDRVDFRETIEEQIKRYNDLSFTYLDACKPTHPYHFAQCAHCQTVRSSQFAIYRITPQTDAETYIAIGMSIALETQFGYDIPKIFFTNAIHDVPSLLSSYEMIEAVNTKERKQRLRKALPVVMQRVQECAWNPQVLPFEATVPLIHDFPVREEIEVVEIELKQNEIEALLTASTTPINIKRGDVVEGVIVRIDQNEILVDIGLRSEGVLSTKELPATGYGSFGELHLNDRVLVYVIQPETSEGRAVLSVKRANTERSWRIAEDQYKNGELLKAKVIDFNKGGLIVDVAGIRGFVPILQILNLKREEVAAGGENQETATKLQSMKDKELQLKITEINRVRNRLILSERLAVQEWRQRRREELFDELKPGEVRRGVVSNLANFGAFVDLGGVDGLVHISQIAWSRVNHPSDVLHVGQEVKVQVLSVDKEKKKIALSIKHAGIDL